MKYILLFLFVPAFALADNLPVTYTCSTPGCTFPDGIQILSGSVTDSVSGSRMVISESAQVTYQIPQAIADVGNTPFSFTGQVSWSDPLALPTAPAGDYYQMKMQSFGGNFWGDDPDSPTFANPNPVNYVGMKIDGATYNAGCDAGTGFPCPLAFNGAVGTAGTSIDAIGNLSFEFDNTTGEPYRPSLNESHEWSTITITRYDAAGNPDPFLTAVPEPFSYGLVVFGLGIVGLAAKRRFALKGLKRD